MEKDYRTKHSLYKVFSAMLQRCYNPKNKSFKDYGGRGIVICEEWINDYMSFFNWCVQNGWQVDKALDRKNNDGIYSPDNCRFVTDTANLRNKRTTVMVEYKGENKPLREWAAIIEMPYTWLNHRIRIQKLPINIAFDKNFTLTRKKDIRADSVEIGQTVKKYIKHHGRKNMWIIKKMNEAGFDIDDPTFSNKIYGIKNCFDKEETDFIFSLY